MYTLSRDYARLFDLLCTGQVLVGWVRYSESLRDVVKIERRAEFDIYIGVRGICYTDLGTFDREKGEERDVFAARCESVDLEWIEPSVPRAEVAAALEGLRVEYLELSGVKLPSNPKDDFTLAITELDTVITKLGFAPIAEVSINRPAPAGQMR